MPDHARISAPVAPAAGTSATATATADNLNPTALRELLVTDIGIDADLLTQHPDATLADLGLDSIALVELGVVLQDRHGVGELPNLASTMTFPELAGHLCRAA